MKKKKKKKSKIKRFILLVILFSIIIGGAYLIYYASDYSESNTRCLYVNNNVISFDCKGGYKYVHIKLSISPENHIKYNIINPKGKVVMTDELSGNKEFFGNGEKGIWKVTFDTKNEVNVDYKVWEGNLKFRDSLEKA